MFSNSLTVPYSEMIRIQLFFFSPIGHDNEQKIAKSRNDGPEVKSVNAKKASHKSEYSLPK